MKKFSVLLFVCFSFAASANKKEIYPVNVKLENQSIRVLFSQIEVQLDLKFSYNTSLLNADSIISYNASKPLTKVINEVFRKQLKSKIVGNYIVLVRRKIERSAPITISGYVYNSVSKSPLPYTSIYEVGSKQSTLTNANGKFELTLEKGTRFDLSIAKKNYTDTLISTVNIPAKNLKIYLQPTLIPLQFSSHPASSAQLKDTNQLLEKLVTLENRINAENLQFIQEKNNFQVSLIPNVGSNFKSSGIIENRFSFNILGGYNGGLNGIEIGGLFNILTKNMRGIQIAGITNQVQGTTYGFQVAGIHNRIEKNVTGFQVAGISNFLHDSLLGVQVSGISNYVNGTFEGFQIGGIHNHVIRNFKGLQTAGILNWAHDDLIGMQVSGINNTIRGSLIGMQVAGIHNLCARDVNGVQVSAIHNQSFGSINGLQLSLVNYAKVNNGLQLGLVNLADSANGIAIGLFNYVKNGYHPLAIFVNEVLSANFAFKSGVNAFYTTWTFGFRPSEPTYFGVGFGIGSRINTWKWLSLSIDATSTFINESELDSSYELELNLLNRLDITMDFNIKKFTLFIGPGLNIHISKMGFEKEGKFTSDIAVDPFYTEVNENTQVQFWWGAKAGFRYNF